MQTVLQVLAIGLSKGAVYALVALGITLIYRTTKILQFAQGQVLMVAVFVSLTVFNNPLQNPLAPKSVQGIGKAVAHLPIAWLIGLAVAVLLGILIELGVRPTLKYGGSLGWILATVGMATIIQFGAVYIWPAEDRLYPGFFRTDAGIPGFGTYFSQRQIFTIVVALVLMVGVDYLYNKTKLGRAMKAVAIDRDAAALMGISAKSTIRWAFILASGLAAIAGFLVAPLTFANIAMGFNLGVSGFIAAVLGGIDSARGAIAGGFLLGLFEAGLPQVLDKISPTLGKFPEPFVFALFILVLVFRPQGIFGSAIREAR